MVIYKNQSFSNYKVFFTWYFSDTEKFIVESSLENHLEKLEVKSIIKHDFLKLSIWLLIDNGNYSQLLGLQFTHPHSPGFTKLQMHQVIKSKSKYAAFTEESLNYWINLIEERLTLGWEEFRYFKDGKYYKSKVIIHSEVNPQVFVHRQTQKSFLYLLASFFFAFIYYKLNPKIRIEHKVVQSNWLNKNPHPESNEGIIQNPKH